MIMLVSCSFMFIRPTIKMPCYETIYLRETLHAIATRITRLRKGI